VFSPELIWSFSRCSKFRFKSLGGEDAGARLMDIAARENVKYEDGVIQRLLEVSEGDMRRAVTYLQSSFNLTSAAAAAGVTTKSSRERKIIEDDSDEEMDDAPDADPSNTSAIVTLRTVEEVAGVIPTSVVENLASTMQTQPKGRGTVYEAVSKQITEMVADGWSANQLLTQLYSTLIADETLDLRKKRKILGVFSDVDKRLVDGADEELTIMDLSLRLTAILNGEVK
jgi:replication factor C subunit 2/4